MEVSDESWKHRQKWRKRKKQETSQFSMYNVLPTLRHLLNWEFESRRIDKNFVLYHILRWRVDNLHLTFAHIFLVHHLEELTQPLLSLHFNIGAN